MHSFFFSSDFIFEKRIKPLLTLALFGSLPNSKPDLLGLIWAVWLLVLSPISQAIQGLRTWASLAPRKRRGRPFFWGLAWASLDGAPAVALTGHRIKPAAHRPARVSQALFTRSAAAPVLSLARALAPVLVRPRRAPAGGGAAPPPLW